MEVLVKEKLERSRPTSVNGLEFELTLRGRSVAQTELFKIGGRIAPFVARASLLLCQLVSPPRVPPMRGGTMVVTPPVCSDA
jgi:hypothetical protein